ncbi:Cysteine-rich receptor-like protein kinase 2 [Capsicum baccatum]|uniref:Cysteine-rich receptor-like protein kinase 2 n=1 Tax=Capsicum baccatum TaxID=33114 RepID=A0A2G2VPT2_CAPBA|nr:Cysteine-rich receptor-like protein kinase 2 [Capsicum baccatum]
MRADNYKIYDEYLGPEDRRICRNRTTKGTMFQENARRAVQQAVAYAPSNNGLRACSSGSSSETAYVLADCWKTLNANSCAACLRNASASMLGCLPWSEGRALYTGCFMSYSDTNFLNAISTSGGSSSRGKVIVIVIVVSSIIVLGKQIQKKRKGANDAEKLVEILHDISLNFKYSTLDKATRSFDEANKLGQGGFGTVYKHFQRGTVEEIFDPNLMLQNNHTINVKNEVMRFLHVGLLCAQEVPTLRPSMSKALQMFVKKDEELPPPTKPPFVDEKTMQLHVLSLEQGDSATTANLSHSSLPQMIINYWHNT